MKRQIALFSIIAAILFAAPQLAKAGHWEHQGRLESDTYYLHQATHRLHELIHHRTGFSHLDDEAHHLDEAAAHFAETAALGGSLSHLRADFNETARELRHVQSQLLHACHVRNDWLVQQTWADVERAFDRVYYDLYSRHCGFISYTCQIGGGHFDDHHHGHHNNVGGFPHNVQKFPINQPHVGGSIKLGPVTIQTKKVFSDPSPKWNNHFNKGFKN
ncbi:hypothetical protein LOC68_22025 [Blastopirellula sp. JC732]|uniref:DUF3347 domain-containing protein n=1 Tax=Blastopirellula sediminis TaxID=2894196 RepID=A0A9X1SLU8_9BACT|nr:hypothetical protein [Blastopirellula sediminis]MCC9605621.1 hypothetical protein [Blastopirellula sediminis]MCC9631079.1 hypothetical protein [Blastopirellula sediminis]